MNLNLGGGSFSYPGWLNLDASTGFNFTKDCVFPIGSAPVIYSSHCLEHLDDETVDRVLSECRRVCEGQLVLKLPDFEDVLRRRAAGDHDYFKQWGMDGLTHMWAEDTINARASMIFCGYWNDAYGHEFTGPRRPHAFSAYHGPVGVPAVWSTPHQIAEDLKSCAPEGAIFNHQNAWSRAELTNLLDKHDFDVLSMDAEDICQMPIPTINDMKAISMYVYAR